MLDPVGVYIGGWDELHGQEFITKWKNHEKTIEFCHIWPSGSTESGPSPMFLVSNSSYIRAGHDRSIYWWMGWVTLARVDARVEKP